MTYKNRWVPRWTQLSESSFSHRQDELPVELILPVHAKRESLLPIGCGRAECTQGTVANYRAATSFTGQLSRPVYRVLVLTWTSNLPFPAGISAYRLIRECSPLRRHPFGAALGQGKYRESRV